MTELRDYILSKLQEQLGKAKRNPAGVKAVATWKRNRRLGKPGSPVRVGQSDTGEEAALHMEKKAGELKGKLKSRAFKGVGQTEGGMRAWSNIQQGHSADARQDASTDLRTQLAYVLADKLEELSQETMDSAAIKRTDMLRAGHRGKEVPIYKGGTGATDEPEQIGTRTTAGTGVIQGRLQGRKATPDKPAKKSLYAGKITPGVTGKEGRAKFFAARAARREDSSTDLRTQLMYILANKLDEYTLPGFQQQWEAAKKRQEQEAVERRRTSGMRTTEPPKIINIPPTKKPTPSKQPTPSKEQLMRIAAKAARKPMPKITDVDVSEYIPKPDPAPKGYGSKGPIISTKPDLTKGIRFK